VKIDLGALDSDPVRFQEKVELPEERFDTDLVAGVMEVTLTGEVRRRGEIFFLSGRFEVSGELSCARCLEPLEWRTNEEYAVELRPADDAPSDEEIDLDEGDLEVVFIKENELSLEDFAAEQVVLALPIRALCRENCAGLCSRCGANLNVEGECRCEPDVDPRWEALRGLGGLPS
jgi:uncharacterized protein